MIRNELLEFGPNVIAATSGSGTRVLARIVEAGGMFIGSNRNKQEDALDLTAFSDRWINAYWANSSYPSAFTALQEEMATDLSSVLQQYLAPLNSESRVWGWKQPRSIYLLPFYHHLFPTLKLVHLIRDGRDMAFSANQNHFIKHRHLLLTPTELNLSIPTQLIILWGRINLMVANYGENKLKGQYLLVRFEDLCADPIPVIRRIFDFLDINGNLDNTSKLYIVAPTSIGRWRNQDSQTIQELHQIGGSTLYKFGYLNEDHNLNSLPGATQNSLDRLIRLSDIQFPWLAS